MKDISNSICSFFIHSFILSSLFLEVFVLQILLRVLFLRLKVEKTDSLRLISREANANVNSALATTQLAIVSVFITVNV